MRDGASASDFTNLQASGQARAEEMVHTEQEAHDVRTSTLQRFEKLIQETQQSDEGSLLKHIQRNLEQLKAVGDYS